MAKVSCYVCQQSPRSRVLQVFEGVSGEVVYKIISETSINLQGTLTWEPLQPHKNLQSRCWNAGGVSRISGPSALPPPAVWVPEALRCVCRVCLPRSGRWLSFKAGWRRNTLCRKSCTKRCSRVVPLLCRHGQLHTCRQTKRSATVKNSWLEFFMSVCVCVCVGRTLRQSHSTPAGYTDTHMSTRWRETCTSRWGSKKRSPNQISMLWFISQQEIKYTEKKGKGKKRELQHSRTPYWQKAKVVKKIKQANLSKKI